MAATILYGHPKSSATSRVRITLGLKGVEHDFREVDLFSHENLGTEYLTINPLCQVPALDIDGELLTQSVAICEYLEETRPEPALLPSDPVKRAQCRELVEMINAAIQPLQNKGVLEKLIADYDDTRMRDMFRGIQPEPGAGDSWPQHWIRKGLTAFEAKLATTAGQYCVGDQITLADVFLAPQITGTRLLYRLDLSAFPTIVKIHRALGDIAPFRDVRPQLDR